MPENDQKITINGEREKICQNFFSGKDFPEKKFRKKTLRKKLSGKNFLEKTFRKKHSGKNFPEKTFQKNFLIKLSDTFFLDKKKS